MKKKQIKLTFLGTGTSHGIPVINSDDPVCMSNDKKDKRLRSSVLIQWGSKSFVIDCGPDFRYQMLRGKVTDINAIFFTHEHSDHIAGLDDIRPYCYKKGPMTLYGMERVLKSLEKRYDYIFQTENRYPGAASVNPIVFEKGAMDVEGVKITPIKINHGSLPILGYRFNDLAYLTDVKTIDTDQKEKLKNLDTLVLSALRIDPHFTHLNLEEALALVDELKPKQTFFTHISHNLGFHAEVESQLPDHIHLAYDTLSVLID